MIDTLPKKAFLKIRQNACEADIDITATGLDIKLLGGVQLEKRQSTL